MRPLTSLEVVGLPRSIRPLASFELVGLPLSIFKLAIKDPEGTQKFKSKADRGSFNQK